MRLTLLYGSLFLVAGVLLLAVTYVLVAHVLPWSEVPAPKAPVLALRGKLAGPQVPALQTQLARQHAEDLNRLLIASGIALGLMTLGSVWLGWLVAGRVLYPLRTMTTAAKAISANDLHRRLDAQGPDDEIKELADTFDELLAHLDDAFEAQRRFVANASHELRTPLTFERSLLEVALADPDIPCSDLRAVCRRVLVSNQQQGALIEALLALARSQRGMQHRADLDLAILAGRALADTRDGTLEVDVTLNAAPVSGDPALIERLIANLVDNALRYNVTDGSVTVSTGVVNGHSALRVRNTGPVIQPDEVDSLFEPFQRLHATRTHGRDGAGVGLSIVAAIAKAHGATIAAQPGPQGGLSVNVTFPTPTTHTATLHPTGRSDVGKTVTGTVVARARGPWLQSVDE